MPQLSTSVLQRTHEDVGVWSTAEEAHYLIQTSINTVPALVKEIKICQLCPLLSSANNICFYIGSLPHVFHLALSDDFFIRRRGFPTWQVVGVGLPHAQFGQRGLAPTVAVANVAVTQNYILSIATTPQVSQFNEFILLKRTMSLDREHSIMCLIYQNP